MNKLYLFTYTTFLAFPFCENVLITDGYLSRKYLKCIHTYTYGML